MSQTSKNELMSIKNMILVLILGAVVFFIVTTVVPTVSHNIEFVEVYCHFGGETFDKDLSSRGYAVGTGDIMTLPRDGNRVEIRIDEERAFAHFDGASCIVTQ